MSVTQVTQVIDVAASRISGLEVQSVAEFEFEGPVSTEVSALHKVDNGMVYSYGGKISDISFDKIPRAMMPVSTQNSYQWYCDRYAKGIANSVLGTDGAGYLKRIRGNELAYEPACNCLRANTKPWVLFSDLPYGIFRRFDAVKLYADMAARAFAYSTYDVTWLDERDRLVVSRGLFLAVPLAPDDLSPSYFLNDAGYRLSVAFHANQQIRLFWPAFWVGPVTNSALALGADDDPVEKRATGLGGLI